MKRSRRESKKIKINVIIINLSLSPLCILRIAVHRSSLSHAPSIYIFLSLSISRFCCVRSFDVSCVSFFVLVFVSVFLFHSPFALDSTTTCVCVCARCVLWHIAHDFFSVVFYSFIVIVYACVCSI